MDQGYPGTVEITFSIRVWSDNSVVLSYSASPDRPTHINLTHHLYYNLVGSGPATGQWLAINSGSILETAGNYIPTGEIVPPPEVYDFSTQRPIPADTDFNECYVLHKRGNDEIAAVLTDRHSGLTMELLTTCPAIIFYSGQFLDVPFYPKQGICLEAQYFPDAPNHLNFPSTLYDQDKSFREQTTLKFNYTL
jgi:aldose 1-epimerase